MDEGRVRWCSTRLIRRLVLHGGCGVVVEWLSLWLSVLGRVNGTGSVNEKLSGMWDGELILRGSWHCGLAMWTSMWIEGVCRRGAGCAGGWRWRWNGHDDEAGLLAKAGSWSALEMGSDPIGLSANPTVTPSKRQQFPVLSALH